MQSNARENKGYCKINYFKGFEMKGSCVIDERHFSFISHNICNHHNNLHTYSRNQLWSTDDWRRYDDDDDWVYYYIISNNTTQWSSNLKRI